MPLANGAIFAGYTILRLLGAGGMGEVYLVQHPRLPRRDALKVLSQDMPSDSAFRERFSREADFASTLWHPNIVQVHDRGECDGQLWIAMDYVQGIDAGRLVKDQYPAGMAASDACRIIAAVANALDHAHRQGLLHRDVKPANILLTDPEDGERRILLADFGIARQLGEVSGLTATNFTVGTLAFAAPEQLMGSAIDGRADQYALAATAFKLLTGAPPYQGSNAFAIFRKKTSAAPPPLADQRSDLAYLDPVLAKAMAMNPDARFSGCREFAVALSEQITGTPRPDRSAAAATVAAPIPLHTSAAHPTPKPSRRTLLLKAGAAVAVVAATLGAAIAWTTRHPGRTDTAASTPSLHAGITPTQPKPAGAAPTSSEPATRTPITPAVTATIAVGRAPEAVAVDPATHAVYVSSPDDATVSVINPATPGVTATIPVGRYADGVAVDSARGTVYVANYGDNTVAAIDTTTGTVTATLPVGRHPEWVAVNSATRRLYVANARDNTISVIDTAAGTITGTIRVGQTPDGVAFDAGADALYVANSGDNTVSVIDTTTGRVTGTVDVGTSPGGMAVDPAGHTVYVANADDNTVSVLETTE